MSHLWSTDAEEANTSGNVTTVEYDVVSCADYDHEEGAWINNMPDEIRKANPQFVPP